MNLLYLQYSTTLSSIIASFCIIFDICYMMNQQCYIYSRILPVLISACCIQFNHYKMRICSITVFYNTLKHNRIILYHIWYLLHDEPTVLYIFQNTPSIVSACCIEFNHYKMRICSITVFYNTLKHNHIHSVSYLISATWWTNSAIYIPEYSQYWFQHAALNLITKSSEFALLQYSTTLSSIITSFCIIFDICYMMNQQFYIYSRILPVLISTCCIEFNHYKTWIYSITVFYNTLKHNRIILYHIWYLLHDEPTVLYIFQNTPSIDSACRIEFNHYKMRICSITVFYNTLKHNRIILYHIWYLLHDEPTVLYIFQNTPSIVSACCIEFNHYKMRICSITVFYNTLKHNRFILYHIWYLLHDEPTVLYIFQNTPSIYFNMLHWI